MHPYWQQWGANDLLSCQGVEIEGAQDDEHDIAIANILESERQNQIHENRTYDPMYDYGLTWSMFL